VTTLAALALDLPRYDRSKVDTSWHRCAGILGVIDRLVNLDLKDAPPWDPSGPIAPISSCGLRAVRRRSTRCGPCERLRVADRACAKACCVN